MNLNQRTLRLDLFRCSLNGILEVGFNVFVILIAIRFLNASEGYKSVLAAGSAFGFFLMPWTVRISKAFNRPVTQFAGFLMLVCSVSLFFCSQVKGILPYTIYFYFLCYCILCIFLISSYCHIYGCHYSVACIVKMLNVLSIFVITFKCVNYRCCISIDVTFFFPLY